jgi:predicted ATPase
MSRILIRAQVRHLHSRSPPRPPYPTSTCLDVPDYRHVPRALSHAYFSPLDGATRAAIDAQFAALTKGVLIQEGKTLRLWGRNLMVPRSAGNVAHFTFAELCRRAFGAADYLEITQRFGTLFVTDVPWMGLGEWDMDTAKILPSHSSDLCLVGAAVYYVH